MWFPRHDDPKSFHAMERLPWIATPQGRLAMTKLVCFAGYFKIPLASPVVFSWYTPSAPIRAAAMPGPIRR
jgi:hypothetical protein